MTPDLTPRLAVHLRNFSPDEADWEQLVARAIAADRAGIDKLVVSDHVVFGERLEAYARPEIGGVRGGRQPTGPDGHWLEPIALLAYVAARTTRVRLATHVLLAALRRPVVLAKSLSTLDVLSRGRLDVGVGVGWQREEYDAAGLDFRTRGRLLDACVEQCQELWRERSATITPHADPVARIHQMPKPIQPGGVPIWISGTLTRRVALRLARFGSGWIPWGDDALDPRSSMPRMRELVRAAGGDPAGLRAVANLPTVRNAAGDPDIDATVAAAAELLAVGVTDFIVHPPVPDAAAAVAVYSAWSSAFRRAVGQ